jgi:hypothetical protein
MYKIKSALATVLAGAATALAAVSGASTASAADLSDDPAGDKVTVCGPRYSGNQEWLRRCGQTAGSYGRIGTYHSSTNTADWDAWFPTVSKCVVDGIRLATDGERGEVTAYPQFRRASDGHIVSRGSQASDSDHGYLVRLGYFDHADNRFHPTSIWQVGVSPSLYPTEPRPASCSIPTS